jgi:hypothetical protein
MSDFLADILEAQNTLCHHGIKGQKWGVRRYQNPDGSLTEEGRKRYISSNGATKKTRALFKYLSENSYGTGESFNRKIDLAKSIILAIDPENKQRLSDIALYDQNLLDLENMLTDVGFDFDNVDNGKIISYNKSDSSQMTTGEKKYVDELWSLYSTTNKERRRSYEDVLKSLNATVDRTKIDTLDDYLENGDVVNQVIDRDWYLRRHSNDT